MYALYIRGTILLHFKCDRLITKNWLFENVWDHFGQFPPAFRTGPYGMQNLHFQCIIAVQAENNIVGLSMTTICKKLAISRLRSKTCRRYRCKIPITLELKDRVKTTRLSIGVC